jgi:hypothetical protein
MNERLTMLYAQVNDKSQWPMKWEKCELMHKHLNRMSWSYQLILERRMLFDALHPEYRGVLVKWENGPTSVGGASVSKHGVLLETSDPEQMEAALLMLISEAEEQAKAVKYEVGEI